MIMPARSSLFAALVLGSVMAGCRSRAGADGAGASDTAASTTTVPSTALAVRLERQPCYGRCPEYTVEVFFDGRVRYVGNKNVQVLGEQSANIAVADVSALLKLFADAGFATADSAYVEGSPRCGRYFTDGPHAVIGAHLGNTFKSVHIDAGCSERPQYFSTLAAQVDSVTRAHLWVNGETNK